MSPEPITTTAIVAGALSGAAGNLISDIGKQSVKWLAERFGPHSKEVQQKANQNTEQFLISLANKIEKLESQSQTNTDKQQIFDAALKHPSTSLLIQKALVSASSTDNKLKHDILAELINNRLQHSDEDLQALISRSAVDIIESLNEKHIKLLGFLTYLLHIRPANPPGIDNQDKYNEYMLKFWSAMEPLFTELPELKYFDYQHLISLGCITREITTRKLSQLLTLAVKDAVLEQYTPDISYIQERLSWWNDFTDLYNANFGMLHLTSIGLLIGILYADSRLGKSTKLDL